MDTSPQGPAEGRVQPAGQGPLIRVVIWPENVSRFGIPLTCIHNFNHLTRAICQMDSKDLATSSVCIHMPTDDFVICGMAKKITANTWNAQLVHWLLQGDRYIQAHFYDRIPSRIFVPANVFTASPIATSTTVARPSAALIAPPPSTAPNTAGQYDGGPNDASRSDAAPNTASAHVTTRITASRSVVAPNAAVPNAAFLSTAVPVATVTHVPAAPERVVWDQRPVRKPTVTSLDLSSEEEPPNKKPGPKSLRRSTNKPKNIILRLAVSSRTEGFHPLEGWRNLKLSLPATADFDDIHHAIAGKLEIQLSDTAIVDPYERLKDIGVETVIGNQVLLESGPRLEGYAEVSADVDRGGKRRRSTDEDGEKQLSGRVELWLEIGQVFFQTYEKYSQSKAQEGRIESKALEDRIKSKALEDRVKNSRG